MLRLQVFLSHSGIASRRSCEALITDGRVSVNGSIVRELGTKVSDTDTVCLDGKKVSCETKLHYILLHKPPFFLCSSDDPENRPLAIDLLPKNIKERLYNVGRLDYLSSGAVLFTNDGAFASRVGHPGSGIEKEYIVRATNLIPSALLSSFAEGIEIEGENYKCKSIEKIDRRTVRIVLIEGKNREIRKVFSFFHLHTKSLCRVRIGKILLGDLPLGKTRTLSADEIMYDILNIKEI
ncbi:MAG: pseudouridine synthase [Termitinemataceae bacterium]|nr:MAG: pseudouridine synthase [Termitinemataceae bacterium]